VYWLSGASVVAVAWMIVADMASRIFAAQTRVLILRGLAFIDYLEDWKRMSV
jgi:hypothetical protein